jgi:riboflavin synthase
MFTGIVTDLGQVRAIKRGGDTRFELATRYDTAEVAIGASICCSGACLTVIDKGPDWFAVQASAETLARTTLGAWREGTPVNLERALRAGDELGGHLVTGHVDGVGTVRKRASEGESVRLVFQTPDDLARFIAPKGSITVDGVSLTVNEVAGASFGVNVIPHTQQATTLGRLKSGDRVNLEIDLIARYVARLLGKG